MYNYLTDYEFVEAVIKAGGFCGGLDLYGLATDAANRCALCPLSSGPCWHLSAVCERAKLWLESHKKENSMDGIKVTVEEKKANEKAKYPCYKIQTEGISKGAIVYFVSPRKGTVIVGSENRPVGEGGDNWAEFETFKPFHGTIKIEVE